ncbi:MAG: glucokinase [Thermodesulfobacteriota bacterium]
MTIILGADIGGTKSELALFDLQSFPNGVIHHSYYLNAQFDRLEQLIDDFINRAPVQPDVACLGAAGLVSNGSATMTNLKWTFSEEQLGSDFSLSRVRLINDLTAVCAGATLLDETDCITLQEGEPEETGLKGVIAPGTGLGEGMLLQRDGALFAQGSEGGHCNFAPMNEEQKSLLNWMHDKYQTVSYEMLCSGVGIPNLYHFFKARMRKDNEVVEEGSALGKDITPLIVENGLKNTPCPVCRCCLETFLAILGAEAGNLALKLYCRGGLFIGGGILPRLHGKISFSPITESFVDKGQMAHLLKKIPLRLIMKKDIALYGTVQYFKLNR